MAVLSLTGLIKMCRRNVLNEVEKQNPGIAEKLGIKELKANKQDKFTLMEKGLEKEIKEATTLLDNVAKELKQGSIKPQGRLRDNLGLLEKAVADRADGAEDRLVSPVDPTARAGNKTHKHWVGYKGHLIAEEDTEIITAIETTPANVNDGSELKPLLQQQEQYLDIKPAELSGDKGYDSGANLEYLNDKGITGNISLSARVNNHGEDLFTRNEFIYDAVKDIVICPAGCTASHAKRDFVHTDEQKRSGWMYQFSRKNCSVCELRPLCVSSKSKVYGRAIHISIYEPLFQQMRQRMESEEGKQAYHERYKIEHKIADLARNCGMRRCRYRGLDRAGIHSFLAATVSHIKRMTKLVCHRTGKACPILVPAPQTLVLAS